MAPRDAHKAVYRFTHDTVVTDNMLYAAYSFGAAYGQNFTVRHDTNGYSVEEW